jgi:hypothetical protein
VPVVKKKSIFAVTGRETMNVNAKQQSDIFFTLSADIKKTGKKVLVIFEDLERVSNAEDVKRV